MITESLETERQTLAQCRDDIDLLYKVIEEERDIETSKFFTCKLKKNYTVMTLQFWHILISKRQ